MGMYDDRLDAAIEAAKRAGIYLMEALEQKRDISKKGIVDIVTDADKGAEMIIHNIISEEYPDDEFLAEEGTQDKGSTGLTWIVDPLDGTTNYAHRFPVFCVSIGLVKDGIPQAGVIYNPNLDELFSAHRGEGAFLNGDPIKVSDNNQLINSLLATGFPYDIRDSDADNMNNFYAFYKNGAQAVRRAGSAALDLAYTACGRFDGFWEMKLHPWDIAAGVLLVEEAGGKITDFDGNQMDLFKGEIVASNTAIHNEMLKVLREAVRVPA
jgi:myo-inositol-1(or 4)-monophosphatase